MKINEQRMCPNELHMQLENGEITEGGVSVFIMENRGNKGIDGEILICSKCIFFIKMLI